MPIARTRAVTLPARAREAFAKAIPGARLVVLDEAGHLPQLEAPSALLAAVLARDAPVRGSYRHADPMGLVWSMTPAGAAAGSAGVLAPARLEVTATVGGAQVAAASRNHRHPWQHLLHPHAGHLIAAPPYRPATTTHTPGPGVTFHHGGTPQANARACAAAWQQTLRFLRTAFADGYPA